MRKFTLLLILFPLLGFSQIAKVEKFEEIKHTIGMFHNFYEADNGDIVIESIVKKMRKAIYSQYEKNIDPYNYVITILNKNLSLISSTKTSSGNWSNKFLKTIKVDNNKYITITTNTGDYYFNEYAFYIHNFDNFPTAEKKTATIDVINREDTYHYHSVEYKVLQSANKQLFAIIETKEKNDQVTLCMSVYNSNATLLWNKEVGSWDRNLNLRTPYSFALTNEGEVLALTLYEKYNERIKKFESSYSMIDIHTKDDIARIEIPYKNFIVSRAEIVNLNDEFVCIGYKANQEEERSLDGIYSFYIDLEKEKISGIKESDFNSDMIEKIVTLGRNFKETKTNIKVNLERFVKFDDGSMIALGEDNFHIITYGGTEWADYFTGSIFASKIDADGNVEWNTSIPKLQCFITTSYGKHNSFDYVLHNNSLYFIFNDHKGNINNFDNDKVLLLNRPKMKENSIVIAKMDLKTGRYEKQILPISSESKDPHMFTRKAFLTKDNKVVMLIESGKKTFVCQLSLI